MVNGFRSFVVKKIICNRNLQCYFKNNLTKGSINTNIYVRNSAFGTYKMYKDKVTSKEETKILEKILQFT